MNGPKVNQIDLDYFLLKTKNQIRQIERSATPFKRPTKPECRYNLNDISRDDVVQYFKNNTLLHKHWKSIMDQGEKYLFFVSSGSVKTKVSSAFSVCIFRGKCVYFSIFE